MKVLVAVKRVIDYNVKPRVKMDGSGVDLAHYAPSLLPPGPPVFLFLGRLLRDKGIHEYVAAARIVRARAERWNAASSFPAGCARWCCCCRSWR